MAFTPFPSELMIRTLDTGEVVPMGGFKLPKHVELVWAQPIIYKHGVATGDEKIRVAVYSGAALVERLFASDWVALSSLGTLGPYWIGRVRFDFARQHLNKNTRYWFAMETQDYLRDGDQFYLGFQLDWPIQKYDSSVGSTRNFADMSLYGYVDRTP